MSIKLNKITANNSEIPNKLTLLSNYLSIQTVDAVGTTFVFSEGSTAVVFEVTHVSQTIQIGMGSSAEEAIASAAVGFQYATADKINEIGRGKLVTHYHVLGSGAGTTVRIGQGV